MSTLQEAALARMKAQQAAFMQLADDGMGFGIDVPGDMVLHALCAQSTF
jgi:hypothetical protein